jgi:dihydroorotase
VAAAKASGFVHAVKYYPAGATTNSDSGVTSIERVYPVLGRDGEARARAVPARRGHRSGRRTCSIASASSSTRCCARITQDFPALRVVLEHVTTREAAHFVRDATTPIAATITPQHLRWSRSALFVGWTCGRTSTACRS